MNRSRANRKRHRRQEWEQYVDYFNQKAADRHRQNYHNNVRMFRRFAAYVGQHRKP